MSGHHHHGHHHHGHHHHGGSSKVLLIAACLTLFFALVEAIAGYFAHSLTLLGDAGHMALDAFSLGIAFMAALFSKRPPCTKYSYGSCRIETLTAFFSSLLMIGVAIFIVAEAARRFHVETAVLPVPVMLVAFCGLIMNLLVAWILSRGEKTLNVRAALLHVLSDVLGSIAALASGVVIYFTHWYLIDSLLSVIIALLIAISSLKLLKEGGRILMEGVPLHISLDEVGSALTSVANVAAVKELRIWSLSSSKAAISAHIELSDLSLWGTVYLSAKQLLRQYGIEHITLQPGLPSKQSDPYMPHHDH